MWSVGCIISELYSGYPLFPGASLHGHHREARHPELGPVGADSPKGQSHRYVEGQFRCEFGLLVGGVYPLAGRRPFGLPLIWVVQVMAFCPSLGNLLNIGAELLLLASRPKSGSKSTFQ